LAFAAAGVKGLVLSSRTQADLEEVAKQAKQRATNPDFDCLVVVCDISKEDNVVSLVKATVDKFNSIDYAVNNAGVSTKVAY
jgi:NAD(P)-dependent dehydrogenase (short-subunit alcohol dehydrogenase family)